MLSADDGAGGIATFEYDPNGRLIERVAAAGTATFGWTSRNELDVVNDPLTRFRIDYGWTEASQVDTVSYGPSGLVRNYDYDGRGLLESDTLTDGVVPVASFGYLYDADGNVEHKTVDLAGNAMSGVHDYTYDRSGRLVSWDAPGQGPVGYEWDGSGNRIWIILHEVRVLES